MQPSIKAVADCVSVSRAAVLSAPDTAVAMGSSSMYKALQKDGTRVFQKGYEWKGQSLRQSSHCSLEPNKLSRVRRSPVLSTPLQPRKAFECTVQSAPHAFRFYVSKQRI